MIYLDNAATSYQKPPAVSKKMVWAMKKYGANAGRGGHKLALAASSLIYETAEAVAELFGIDAPEQIAFTHNTTMALNMAIKGVLKRGGHVVFTSMEHNSVVRPCLYAVGQRHSVAWADREGYVNPEAVARAMRPDTALVVCNHASNVCGSIQDIAAIGAVAHNGGALFLVDAAQSGGVLPIEVDRQNIDLLAFAGHKSLLGPQGTGGLYVKPGLVLNTILEGGSGSQSESRYHPSDMPDHLTSGTANMPGIAALAEGIRFVKKVGTEEILAHETALAKQLIEGFSSIPGVTVYGGTDASSRVGVVAINLAERDSIAVAQILDEEFDIAVRSGLHCAPVAHQTLGTLDTGGAVRFSPGFFNTKAEMNRALLAVQKIADGRSGI